MKLVKNINQKTILQTFKSFTVSPNKHGNSDIELIYTSPVARNTFIL